MMMTAAQPSLVSMEATIPRFSGADPTYPAARWVEEINDNAEVFGWSPSQKLLMARRALTGVAGLWLRSENTFKSFDELQQALLEEFPYDANPKVIHELMTNRKKKRDESCYEYMLVMKELGKRGGFEDYVAIQYIVDGIEDCVIHKVMLYGVTTYPDLKEKLKIYEYMKSKMAASAKETSETSDPRRQKQKKINYESTVATPSGINGRRPMEMSAKQPSIMFEVRMDEANDYSKETEVTAINTKENENEKCQRQRQAEVVNKHNLQNKKEELLETIEIPIELNKVDEDDELYEEKIIEVEKVVEKEHCSGEIASVKKKDGLARRFGNNKVISEINVMGLLEEEDIQYQDDWIDNKISYNEDEKRIMVLRAMEQEILKRVHENYFSERIMKEEMSKDYHILR